MAVSGPAQVKALAASPVPWRWRDEPTGVAPSSATPMSTEVIPAAGPDAAVITPS